MYACMSYICMYVCTLDEVVGREDTEYKVNACVCRMIAWGYIQIGVDDAADDDQQLVDRLPRKGR